MTRPRKDLESVRGLLAQGLSVAEASRRAGVPRGTVQTWVRNDLDETLHARIEHPAKGSCEFCYYVKHLTETSYAYLLGLYLGDGYIATHPRGVYRLRVSQDEKYTNVIRQCAVAMNWVIPSKVGLVQSQGCKEIASYSKHWPCVLPQHGAGRKHERQIALAPWQRWVAVERHPQLLLRGLIHSDGCRTTNRVQPRGKKCEYTRYMFSNRSGDIRRIFTDACDRAGIEWRQTYEWTISVSPRVGPEDG